MRKVYKSNVAMERAAAMRPAGYLDEIAPAILERTDDGAWYDVEHPAFVAAKTKYANPAKPEPMTLGKLLHGAAAIAKVSVGIDVATADRQAHRTAICLACPQAIKRGDQLAKCKLCGCLLQYKLRVASEKCPDGRW